MLKNKQIPYLILVDDDEDDRFFMREALALLDCPYHLLEFENGFSFLGFLEETSQLDELPYQSWLVVLDLDLPGGITGEEVLAVIRKNDFWKHLPLITLTGILNRELESRVRAMGVCEYLHKPGTIDDLARYVKAYFEACFNQPVSGNN